jgi:hypothetical protein
LILIYQGIEEENLDQKLPGSPGWGLMQQASSSLIIQKQEMLKNQTQILGCCVIHVTNITPSIHGVVYWNTMRMLRSRRELSHIWEGLGQQVAF